MPTSNTSAIRCSRLFLATLPRENGKAVKTLSFVILDYKERSTILQIVIAVEAAPASGLRKVFHGQVIPGIRIEEDRFWFETEVISWVARIGCRIYEVGIGYSTTRMRRAR